MRYRLILPALLAAVLIGCGGGDGRPAKISVTGTVTFEGDPVDQGDISFNDPEKGDGGSATLNSDGSYSLELEPGNYNVAITPPMKTAGEGDDSPQFDTYAEVDNIPERYWQADTSDLTAEVADGQQQHDFEMSAE